MGSGANLRNGTPLQDQIMSLASRILADALCFYQRLNMPSSAVDMQLVWITGILMSYAFIHDLKTTLKYANRQDCHVQISNKNVTLVIFFFYLRGFCKEKNHNTLDSTGSIGTTLN